MKIHFELLFITVLLFCACSSKRTEEQKVETIPASETISLLDSSKNCSYIGFVNQYYFQNTDEFFIELYFKNDNIEDDEYTRIAESGDSTIFEDEENKRTRIPYAIARKVFDLSGLDSLSLFDSHHRFLTKAHFVRVEYLDQNISPVFTAVFKADNPDCLKKSIYCIGNLQDKFVSDTYTHFEKSALTREIGQTMGYSSQNFLEGKHYRTKDQSVISVINSDTTAYIVEKKNVSYDCLYKSTTSESINDLIFVPVRRNNRPILLVRCTMPDTDVDWNELLVFDGKNYQIAERQRIVK